MSRGVQPQGERVRNYLIQGIVEKRPHLVTDAMRKFEISRQGVQQHLTRLRIKGFVQNVGSHRKPLYELVPVAKLERSYPLNGSVEEHEVWENDIKPFIAGLPLNVMSIWHHAFTEMFNNAIDHSESPRAYVRVTKTALSCSIDLHDDGVGIFRKIAREFQLDNERHALFELSKGKLTTDSRNHSGEGIFFTSRMLDFFVILSSGLYFNHNHEHKNDYLMDSTVDTPGTLIRMAISNHSSRTTKKIFDKYSGTDGDYGFTKTVVPINLASFGEGGLVSRSQAKRALARVHLFEHVALDFQGVTDIGQAFADQIFRVYANDNPNTRLTVINANATITGMIRRAQTTQTEWRGPVHASVQKDNL